MSHRHVLLCHGCPKWNGSMTCVYFGKPKHFIGVGFSTAIFGQSAFRNALKNSAASTPPGISRFILDDSAFVEKPLSAGRRQVCTRRMRDDHIPLELEQFHGIRPDVPFRVSAGAFLYVARIRLMAQPAQLDRHRLRFLARYQNSHTPASPSALSLLCAVSAAG